MSRVLFYAKETGIFHPVVVVTDCESAIAANTPEGHVALVGDHDPACYRVDIETGAVVDYQPPAPSADHEWSAQSKRWVLSEAVATRNATRAAALTRIAQLEGAQARPIRELARDPSNADARKRIDAIDDEIAGLRVDLAPPL